MFLVGSTVGVPEVLVRMRTGVGMLVRGLPVAVKVAGKGLVGQTRSRQTKLRLLAHSRVARRSPPSVP